MMWPRCVKSNPSLLLTLLQILAGTLLVLAIAVSVVIFNLAEITQAAANRYLSPYNSQLTQLTITPSSLLKGHIPALSLRVNDSRVAIRDLQLTLAEEISWLTPSMDDIESIALGELDIALSAAFFTTQSATSQSQPAIALNLARLPQIAVGTTHFHIETLTDKRLSLDLDYLNLDNLGRLTSAISHQGAKLLTLDARLGEKQWHANTRLSFDVLGQLIDQLTQLESSQQMKLDALTPLIALKQTLDAHHFTLNGALVSALNLDIASAHLSSTHQLEQLTLSLDEINHLALPTPIDISPEAYSYDIVNPQRKPTFELSGPLSQLALTLQPMQIALTLSPQQTKTLQTMLSKDINRTLAAQPNPLTEPNIQLMLQLTGPLTYALYSQELRLTRLKAWVAVNDNHIDGRLDDVTLTNVEGKRSLNGLWQLSLAQKQKLCVEFSARPKAESNRSKTAKRHELSCTQSSYEHLAIDAIDLSLQGKLSLNDTPATDWQPNDNATHFPYRLELTIDAGSQLSVAKPDYQTPALTIGAKKISAQLDDRLILKMTGAKNEISFGRLTANVTGNRFTFGQSPTQIQAGSNQAVAQINSPSRYYLSSHHSELTLGGGKMMLSGDKLGAIQLSPLSLTTIEPRLIADGITAKTHPSNRLSNETTESKVQQIRPQITSAQVQLQSLGELNIMIDQDKKIHHLNLPSFQTTIEATELIRHGLDDKALPLVQQTNIETFSLESEAINSHITAGEMSFLQQSLSALMDQDWRTSLKYRFSNLSTTERYYRLGKQRTRKRFTLNHFALDQALNWHQDASAYQLHTKELWQIDSLTLSSSHHVELPRVHSSNRDISPPTLGGKLQLTSDANQIVNQFERWLNISVPVTAIGDLQLNTHHRLTWQQDTIALYAAFTPQITISEGDINLLPFEQMKLDGMCELNANMLGNSYQSELNCDQLGLNLRAFNPGVLMTDIEAIAKINIKNEQDTHSVANKLSSLTLPIRDADLSKNADIDITAKANTLGGKILLPEFNLNLKAPSDAYLVLQGLDLQQLLAIQPQVGIYADGIFDGVLPLELVNGRVSVTDGRLAARAPGGLIKVDGNPAVTQMRLSQPYLDFAFSALEQLHYSELSSYFDMAANGNAQLKVTVKGQAKDIERPIHLNYTQEENMLQLLKSLQIGDSLQREIEKTMQQ